ncbi:MAG: DUF1570 domain-containing protein [Spirochaetales bacterium]|nr:DUF1570 domain-containing protein [Spirochaetales bacterium]
MRICMIFLLSFAVLFSAFSADAVLTDTTGTADTIPPKQPAETLPETLPDTIPDAVPPAETPKEVPDTVKVTPAETVPDKTPVDTNALKNTQFAQLVSDHYRLFYEGTEANGQDFIQKLEACLALYNSMLHFDLAKLPVKLKVRVFKEKAGFDNYLRIIIRETREDYVYIHYSDLGKCELVLFQKADTMDMEGGLLHQGFVQFLKAFVSNPPVWLQEGLAAYFEQSTYDAAKNKYSLPIELVWLPTLKKILSGTTAQSMITFDSFLTLDKTSAQMQIETFYPQSWGLVYFLLHSENRDINRILWDSIGSLDSALSVKENAERVKEKAFGWFGIQKVEQEFITYISSLQTFSDLVAEGVTYYSSQDYNKAEEIFNSALTRAENNYIPYYYLGLINYNKKNYSEAEALYMKSLELEAPAALIQYAIGVNAYADNDFEKAKTSLGEAKKTDPLNYTEKVDMILNTIEMESVVPN